MVLISLDTLRSILDSQVHAGLEKLSPKALREHRVLCAKLINAEARADLKARNDEHTKNMGIASEPIFPKDAEQWCLPSYDPNHKIKLIKAYRKFCDVSLREAKDWVESSDRIISDVRLANHLDNLGFDVRP